MCIIVIESAYHQLYFSDLYYLTVYTDTDILMISPTTLKCIPKCTLYIYIKVLA